MAALRVVMPDSAPDEGRHQTSYRTSFEPRADRADQEMARSVDLPREWRSSAGGAVANAGDDRQRNSHQAWRGVSLRLIYAPREGAGDPGTVAVVGRPAPTRQALLAGDGNVRRLETWSALPYRS